jgi:hypothetical protein
MTREEIQQADIMTINARQDRLKGLDDDASCRERALIEERREQLAIEVYGPVGLSPDAPRK